MIQEATKVKKESDDFNNHISKHSKSKKLKKNKLLFNKRKRYNEVKTLFELTKEFMEYICDSECKVIELNKFSGDLGVLKRRSYDITNILEGKIIYFK